MEDGRLGLGVRKCSKVARMKDFLVMAFDAVM
jgi:hypothetical protein